MSTQLEEMDPRIGPFECHTAADIWTEEHRPKQVLAYHHFLGDTT